MKNKIAVEHYLQGVVKELEEMFESGEVYVRLRITERAESPKLNMGSGVKFELDVFVEG